MKKNPNPAPRAPELNKIEESNPELEANRRPGRREWLRQVDFWENMKEFILRRIPSGSRSIDQLY